METIFFNDQTGYLRSGWRVAIFLFAYIFLAVFLGTIAQALLAALNINASLNSGVFLAANAFSSLIPAVVVGWLCGKYLEELPFRALGAAFTNGWFRNTMLGLFIGALTLAVAIAIGMLFGGIHFQLSENTTLAIASSMVTSFIVFGVAAAFEEALFRGYILQTFARSGFAWLAILLTSVFFGAVHYGNPNANLISTANTVLAGIWFSIAYLKTRDLWFVWGLHLMWNWMQGAFFGIEVSGLTGITPAPLLKEFDSGPSWLTGQSYGVEGGIICTIALITSAVAIYFLPGVNPDEELLAMSSPQEAKMP